MDILLTRNFATNDEAEPPSLALVHSVSITFRNPVASLTEPAENQVATPEDPLSCPFLTRKAGSAPVLM